MLFLFYFICITFFKGIYGENIELNIPIERRQDEPTTNLTTTTETPDFTSTIDTTVSSVSNPVTTVGMTTSSDSTEITTISITDTESTEFTTTTTSVSVSSEIPESTSSTELTVSTDSIPTTEEITSSIISDSTTTSTPEITTLSNPETTTFISNAVDYDEECRRIFTWSRNVISFTPIFPVPCRYYCRVNGIRLYVPFKDRDFTACGNEMVCLKGTCAERPNAEDAAYCNNLFPGRRMTVIRHFFSCYMKCYDLNSSQTYLTRAQNGSSCRSLFLNFDGICSDGLCVRQ